MHLVRVALGGLKSLCVLPVHAEFLAIMKDKNNLVEPHILRSRYFNQIIGKEEGTVLEKECFYTTVTCVHLCAGNCLHVLNIFANPCYYLQRELVYDIK